MSCKIPTDKNFELKLFNLHIKHLSQCVLCFVTCVTAESRGGAAPSLGSAGPPSSLAGGEQVVLLHASSRFRGAQQAAEGLPAADAGAEAAAPVAGATGHALGGEKNRVGEVTKYKNILYCLISVFLFLKKMLLLRHVFVHRYQYFYCTGQYKLTGNSLERNLLFY